MARYIFPNAMLPSSRQIASAAEKLLVLEDWHSFGQDYDRTLMAWYDNFSAAAWVYTAMQGSYGLVWILKDVAFPDPNWQKRITIGGGINAFLGVLGWYWVFGWLLISAATIGVVVPLLTVVIVQRSRLRTQQ